MEETYRKSCFIYLFNQGLRVREVEKRDESKKRWKRYDRISEITV